MRRLSLRRYRPKFDGRHFTVLAVIWLITSLVLSAVLWDGLSGIESGDEPGSESASTTIRNIGLVIGGVLAILLAFWRSSIADRQAAAAQRQADTAQKQSETAERGLLNERYQQGAEMLGSGVLSVRLGGIYALQRLAEEHPEQYHVQIMQLFCAFVRHPTKDDGGAAEPDEKARLREDVQDIMAAISIRGEAGIALEKKAGFALDLHGADLSGVFLPTGANLSGALLFHADLSSSFDADPSSRTILARVNLSEARLMSANLMGADLFGAKLIEADLSGAKLMGATLTLADFSEAVLSEANLSEALLFDAENLTQVQLDQACADIDRRPKFSPNAVDAETGEPLIWRGKSCRDA